MVHTALIAFGLILMMLLLGNTKTEKHHEPKAAIITEIEQPKIEEIIIKQKDVAKGEVVIETTRTVTAVEPKVETTTTAPTLVIEEKVTTTTLILSPSTEKPTQASVVETVTTPSPTISIPKVPLVISTVTTPHVPEVNKTMVEISQLPKVPEVKKANLSTPDMNVTVPKVPDMNLSISKPITAISVEDGKNVEAEALKKQLAKVAKMAEIGELQARAYEANTKRKIDELVAIAEEISQKAEVDFKALLSEKEALEVTVRVLGEKEECREVLKKISLAQGAVY